MDIYSYITLEDLEKHVDSLGYERNYFLKVADYSGNRLSRLREIIATREELFHKPLGIIIRIDASKASNRKSLQKYASAAKQMYDDGVPVTLTASTKILERVDVNILKKLGVRVLTLETRLGVKTALELVRHGIYLEIIINSLIRRLMRKECHEMAVYDAVNMKKALLISFNGLTPTWVNPYKVVESLLNIDPKPLFSRWWHTVW